MSDVMWKITSYILGWYTVKLVMHSTVDRPSRSLVSKAPVVVKQPKRDFARNVQDSRCKAKDES